jgi:cellulose synthase/poly-beta-1,6-N-acetylglucosamine synthase-like glycosyltransferase
MVKVSIVTPTRGRDMTTLKRCVGSIQIQTLTNFEHIVCSEGAEEVEPMTFINGLNDSRFKYRCIGELAADFGNMVRHKMLQWEVSGEYVYFFDDDNLCFPWFLERMIGEIDRTGADFVVCSAMYYYGSYKVGYIRPKIMSGIPMEVGNIDPVQVVVRSNAMKAIGWRTDGGYSSDGVTLLELARKHKGSWIDDVMCVHM